MSRQQTEFEVSDYAVVEVTTFSGDVGVDIGGDGSVVVDLASDEQGYEVAHVGSRLTIEPRAGRFRRFRGGDINLVVPAGTDLVLKTTSGDVRMGSAPRDAGLGRVEVFTAAGDVRLEKVRSDVRAKTASGDLYVAQVGGTLTAVTASGDVRVNRVEGDLEVTTASGDAHIASVGGAVGFRTASGDLNIAHLGGSSLRGKSLSGDVRLGIPTRREIQLDLDSLAGDFHHDLTPSGLEPQGRLRLDISVVSGDVYLYDA